MSTRTILIGTPIKEGLTSTYLTGFVDTMRTQFPGIRLEFAVLEGPSVNLARNEIAHYAKELGARELVFIDADIKWTVGHFKRLISHEDLDIVGGIYCKKKSGRPFWLMNPKPGGLNVDSNAELEEVNDIATGFMKIRIDRVFPAIEKHFPELEFWVDGTDGKPAKKSFEYFPMGVEGPRHPKARLARVKAALARLKEDPTTEPLLDRLSHLRDVLAEIDQACHDEQPPGMLRGEDYYFPVAPSTPVLDADWRWRPLESFNVGESVISVDEKSPPSSSRRMQVSRITHITKRVLPEYRIVTENREFRTTAEHPWLAKPNRKNLDKIGWVWTPTAKLAVGGYLARVTPVAENPDLFSRDYMAGYIQGMFHGDGYMTKKDGELRGYMVKMCDNQPLERLSLFLGKLGIESRRNPLRVLNNPNHRPMHGLSVGIGTEVSKMTKLVSVEAIPSKDFAAGYLAAKYDCDGHYQGCDLNIASIVEWKRERAAEAMKALGMAFTNQTAKVQYLCDTDSVYEFWMKTQPAMRRKMIPIGQKGNDGVIRTHEVHHRLERVLSVESTGRKTDMWCPTTETGTFIADGIASHNCHLARQSGCKVWADFGMDILPHVGNAAYPITPDMVNLAT